MSMSLRIKEDKVSYARGSVFVSRNVLHDLTKPLFAYDRVMRNARFYCQLSAGNPVANSNASLPFSALPLQSTRSIFIVVTSIHGFV
jgi:hypothetical protein